VADKWLVFPHFPRLLGEHVRAVERLFLGQLPAFPNIF